MSASRKNLPALRFDETDIVVELIGLLDERIDAEIQSARIQELTNRMILLGRKRGRPRKEIEDDEELAA